MAIQWAGVGLCLFVNVWETLCVCVWKDGVCERESYESSNGILSLMWRARPIQSPVNRENVSHDVEGLEQVYDIISVLPQQRYGTERPDSLILPQGLKSCKQPQNIGTGLVPKCALHSRAEWATSDREEARGTVEVQSKKHTLKAKQETLRVCCGWDTRYRHFSLVFSLWQMLSYSSGVCLHHFWSQFKQSSKAALRAGKSDDINTSIHPSPHRYAH